MRLLCYGFLLLGVALAQAKQPVAKDLGLGYSLQSSDDIKVVRQLTPGLDSLSASVRANGFEIKIHFESEFYYHGSTSSDMREAAKTNYFTMDYSTSWLWWVINVDKAQNWYLEAFDFRSEALCQVKIPSLNSYLDALNTIKRISLKPPPESTQSDKTVVNYARNRVAIEGGTLHMSSLDLSGDLLDRLAKLKYRNPFRLIVEGARLDLNHLKAFANEPLIGVKLFRIPFPLKSSGQIATLPIKELHINWCSASTMEASNVTQIPSLEYLNLSHNRIHELEMRSPKLKHLVLSFNPLERLTAPRNNVLEELEVEQCGIPLQFFRGSKFKQLKSLNISYNRISAPSKTKGDREAQFSSKEFEETFPVLQALNLRGNRFDRQSLGFLQSAKTLFWLDLRDNPDLLDLRPLVGVSSLKHLCVDATTLGDAEEAIAVLGKFPRLESVTVDRIDDPTVKKIAEALKEVEFVQ